MEHRRIEDLTDEEIAAYAKDFAEKYIIKMKKINNIISKESYLQSLIDIMDKYNTNCVDDDPDGLYRFTEEEQNIVCYLSHFQSHIESLGGRAIDITDYFPNVVICFSYKGQIYNIDTIVGQGAITTLVRGDKQYEPSITLYP